MLLVWLTLMIINNNSALDINPSTKMPFGHRMCRYLCTSICGCRSYELNIAKLSCRVLMKASGVVNGYIVYHIKEGESQKQNDAVCATNSTNWIRLPTKTRGLKYVRMDRQKATHVSKKQRRTKSNTKLRPRIFVFVENMKPCQIDIETKKTAYTKMYGSKYPSRIICALYIHTNKLIISEKSRGIFSKGMSKSEGEITLWKKQHAIRMCADITRNILFYIARKGVLIHKLESLMAYSNSVNVIHSPLFVAFKDIACDTKNQLLYVTSTRGAVSYRYNGDIERLLWSGRKTGPITFDGQGEVLYYNYGHSIMKQNLNWKAGKKIRDLRSVPKQVIFFNGSLFINNDVICRFDLTTLEMTLYNGLPRYLEKMISIVS